MFVGRSYWVKIRCQSMQKAGDTMRREKIMEILENRTAPIKGAELAKLVEVSRQVVVQDYRHAAGLSFEQAAPGKKVCSHICLSA